MGIEVTSEVAEVKEPNYFTDKWGVSGRVRIEDSMRDATLTVELMPGAPVVPSLRRLVVAHEKGHVDFFEDRLLNEVNLTPQSFVEGDVWFTEVDAWIRGLDNHFGLPLTVTKAMFALDALNSYRRGYNVSEELWLEGKRIIADRSARPDDVMKYEPLEPPPGSPAPKPSITIEGAEWPEEEKPEDKKPGEKGDYTPEHNVDDEVDLEERDNWLLSEEGMAVLKKGSSYHLEENLRARGFPVQHPLPIVAKVTFANNGGHWPYA